MRCVTALNVLSFCREISEATQRRCGFDDTQEKAVQLNRMLVGWANYFSLGFVSKAYWSVDRYGRHRLRQWLCAKHTVRGQGTS